MRSKIERRGASLWVTIPADLARELALDDQPEAEVHLQSGRLVICRVDDCDHLSLDELLEGMTPDKVGAEVEWGPPVGREVW